MPSPATTKPLLFTQTLFACAALGASLTLSAGAAGAAGPAAPPQIAHIANTAGLSAADLARLQKGEVVVRLEPVRRGAPREGVAIGVLDFPPERVFLAVTDFEHYDEFVPFVASADATPQPDGSVLSFQRLDLPAPMSDRSFRLRARSRVDGTGAARAWQVAWSYVPGSGDVKDHHGSWRLARFGPPAANRTLVVCRLFTDPGGALPAWTMDRATRSSLPWVIEGLRLQVRRHRYSAWATGRLLPEPPPSGPKPGSDR
ncbi:MAG TPA: SRPBCC family protein [Thermoanaerobaculia bacterium]|nr:SRPBCC family protein [Thermoanaerobaculia bacterium]